MAKANTTIESMLWLKTKAAIRAAAAGLKKPLTTANAQQIVAAIEGLGDSTKPLRIGIARTFTTEFLNPWLTLEAAFQGLDLKIHHAPFGNVNQEAHGTSGLVLFKPDICLLLLQREDLHPDLAKPLRGFDLKYQTKLRVEVLERLKRTVTQFRQQQVGHVVLSVLPTLMPPGLGIFDAHSERSEGAWWATLKQEIGQFLREDVSASSFLDLDEALTEIGRSNFFDLRLWYSARYPFTTLASREIARRVVALGTLTILPKLKVIVLDADNTLWGGVIGEDGIDGIGLGVEYPGNTFLDFQKRLLTYQQRGFILALCSKNNPADVAQVLKDHPHQILRMEHFAAQRVNWVSKADNLISLAEELNLGLDSFLFVDDSDYECELVRKSLPQVEVVQTPGRSIEIPGCLEKVSRLEVISITSEDLEKTVMYTQERKRRELKAQIQKTQEGETDLGAYLTSLEMKMQVFLNHTPHLTRLSQLTQKTNQFNLTTHRYHEQEIRQFLESDNWLVADFTLEDTFGHHGIVGLALIDLTGPSLARFDTFLMSCRVIGREAEGAFIHALLRHLSGIGIKEFVADYVPTSKNELARNFLVAEGFEKESNGRFRRSINDNPARDAASFPIDVIVEI